MLQGGYFIGGSTSGSGNSGSDDVRIEDGNIVFAPVDPIYIDDNENVFFDNSNKNARMYMDGSKVFVEKVVQ